MAGTMSQRLQFLISANADEAIKVFQKTGVTAEKELGKAESKIDKVGAGFTKFGAGALAFAGVAAAGMYKLGQAASDTAESVNAVNVTFGDAAQGVLKLSDNAAQAVGLSKTQFNQLAVQVAGFAEKVGGDPVRVVDELTTRVADFASVMNLQMSEAATVFTSALSGEQEAIKRFGVDMSAAAVEAFALESGISASASSMTEAEKVQARYGLLMQETSKFAGDFANTSDGAANQQRILTAELSNAASEIGAGLLPIMTKVVTAIGDVVGAFGSLPSPVKSTLGAVAGFGTVAIGAAGALSFIIGQTIKFRDNLAGLGRHLRDAEGGLTKLGAGVGVASVALAGLAVYQTQAAQEQAKLNQALAELSRATDDQMLGALTESLFQALMAGKNFEEVLLEVGDASYGTLLRIKELADAGRLQGNQFLDSSQFTDALNTALATSAERHQQAAVDAKKSGDAHEQFAAAAEQATGATDDTAEALDNAAEAGDRYRQKLKDLYDEVTSQTDAALSYEGAVINLAQSYDDFIAKLIEAQDDGEVTREEYLDLQETMVGLKGEVIDTAKKFTEQSGALDGSRKSIELQIEELQRQKELYPELSDFIQEYIDQLLSIPTRINTSVTVNDGGFFDGGVYDSGPGRSGRKVDDGAVTGQSVPVAPVMPVMPEAGSEAWFAMADAAFKAGQTIEEYFQTLVDQFEQQVDMYENQYELGLVDTESYLAFLRQKQAGLVQYSDEWMSVQRQISRIEEQQEEDRDEAEQRDEERAKRRVQRQREAARAEAEALYELAQARQTLNDSTRDFRDVMLDPEASEEEKDNAGRSYAQDIVAHFKARAAVLGMRPYGVRWARFIRKRIEKAIRTHSEHKHLVKWLKIELKAIPDFEGIDDGEGSDGPPAATPPVAASGLRAFASEQGPVREPVMPGRGGGGVNITVNAGLGADGQQIGREVVKALRNYQLVNGPLPIKVA